jgi:hypothetical protein
MALPYVQCALALIHFVQRLRGCGTLGSELTTYAYRAHDARARARAMQ